MNSMYCTEQIVRPPELTAIMKDLTKQAIRDNPQDVYKWAANYFAQLANQPLPFDDGGRLLSQGGPQSRQSASAGQMVTDVITDAHGFESVEQGRDSDDTNDRIVNEIFQQYDVHGNGRIDRVDLPALIADLKESLGLDISDEQMRELINLADVNEDGTVDLVEFRSLFFGEE